MLPKFDLLLTDPPYGIGESNKKNLSRGKIAAPRDYGEYDWDKKPVEQRLIDTVIANSKNAIVWGGNYYALPPSSCWLVWDKVNGAHDFADCELAWTNIPKAVRLIRHLWNGMLRKGQEERYHPTQKPLGVIEWALYQVTNANTVLDPFNGSGTTGVACIRLGRQYTGIEIEERYCEISAKRFEREIAQGKLFDAETLQAAESQTAIPFG